MEFFDISNIAFVVPVGTNHYALSWIEFVGTFFGLLCIVLASLEKSINYLFGLINVTLFAVIFFQIQLYASLLLQIFFFIANIYGWYAWTRRLSNQEPELKIRWLSQQNAVLWLGFCIAAIWLMTFNIDLIFNKLTYSAVNLMHGIGLQVDRPELQPDAYPFWDSTMMILSMVAMVLMTRKHVENWLLWVMVNLISVVIFALQGVYFMALEYLILTVIASNGVKRWMSSAKKIGSRPFSG